MLQIWIESLQGKLVYIIFLTRHKDVANKQVAKMGYYFRGRGKKCYIRPIISNIYPISDLYYPIIGCYLGYISHIYFGES